MDVKSEPDSDIFEQYENYLAFFSDTNVKHEQNEGSSRGNSNFINDMEFVSNKENIGTNIRGLCEDFYATKDNFSMKVHDAANSMIQSEGETEYHTDDVKCEPKKIIIETAHHDINTKDYTFSESAHIGGGTTPEHTHIDHGAIPENTNSGGSAMREHLHTGRGFEYLNTDEEATPKYVYTGGGSIPEDTQTERSAIPEHMHIGRSAEHVYTNKEVIREYVHTGEGAIPEHTGGGANSIKDEMDVGPVMLQKTDLALAMEEIKQEPVNVQANIVAANTFQEISLSEVLLDTVELEKNIELHPELRPPVEPHSHSGDYVEERLNGDKRKRSCKKRKSGLRNHLNIQNSKIFEEINGIYKCMECEVTFKWLGSVKRHYMQFHTKEGSTQYICDICGNVFKNKYNLTCHIQSKHNTSHINSQPQKTVPCLQCPKVFSTSIYLKRHVDRCHLKRNDKKCVICHTKFILQETLNKHIDKCKSYSKDANIKSRQSHYKHDVEKEANVKSWQCDTCKKVFKNRQGVSDHIRRCHSLGKLCNICGLSYACQSSLNRHMGRAHPVSGRDNYTKYKSKLPKKFKCKKCLNMYSTKVSLTRHMTVCFKNGPRFSCDLCYITLKCESYVNDHKRASHKHLLPYSCDRCKQTFKQKDQITSHINKCFKF